MKQITSFLFQELQEALQQQGESPFRAKQIFEWLYHKQACSFDQMTNLSLGLRQLLAKEYALSCLTLLKTVTSEDGQTVKFLWELKDRKRVESVLIFAPDRHTVCVSCQIGCPARCAFCASGKEGLFRNLTAGEIVEQVLQIQKFLQEKGERVSHIVFMGMGEPLENYEAVVQAIRIFNDPKGLGISQRRITVSTVGVIEQIYRLAREELKVNLVLSLHAPNQHLRKKIIPYARKYELLDILEAMRSYSHLCKRDITYEYTLMAGINDRREHAEELIDLLKDQQCTINLIPYNPVDGLRLKRPVREVIEEFRSVLEEGGLHVTWRYTKGKDIAAACGQLALQKPEEEKLAIAVNGCT